jgi:hypothetical protein
LARQALPGISLRPTRRRILGLRLATLESISVELRGESSINRESLKLHALYLGKVGPMADALERDVQALKEWLRQAWNYLGQGSLTRFERQEIRNQIKQTDAELKKCLQMIAAQSQARRRTPPPPEAVPPPDFRIFDI